MEAKVTNEEKAQTMQNTETVGIESLVSDTIATMKGIPTEAELSKTLKEQILKITFLKLNGDQRVMTCTKSWDIIPENNRPSTTKESKLGTINVWDINAQGWRSFRYDRVQRVENDDSIR